MYGRPYGMGGGMYGMGGGMYGMGGGMYGQGQGQGRSTLERMSMYVYQLCEIAQMVEFNANGLYSFFQLMKNLSVAGVKFGQEWVLWIIHKTIEKLRDLKDWLKAKFRDYFLKQELSKDEL